MATKKKKKRDITAYPGLDKKLFSKVKQEYHDIDYTHTLDDKDKKWLSQFMEEHLGAQLDEKTLKNKYNRKAFHKSKKHRKDCFDRNNARQRDIHGLSKATGRLDDYNSPIVMDYLEEEYSENTEFLEENKKTEILSLEEYKKHKHLLTEEMQNFYIEYYKLVK